MSKPIQKITPFLWFDNNAEEAVDFYTFLFSRSRRGAVARYGETAAAASGNAKGSVMTIRFQLEGQDFVALNGGPHFKFTPAISFFVGCESLQEIDRLWKKLSDRGSVLLPLKNYPFSEKYGWCEDRFGLSWQLTLSPRKQKISPALLFVNEQYGKAEAAMKFYTSVFNDSKIESISRDEQTNAVLHGRFTLDGEEFIAFEPQTPTQKYEFSFNLATSFVVNCETQGEIDGLWTKLARGGSESDCGWLTDQFGVAWQVVPASLGDLLSDADPERSERVVAEIMKMKKLDLDAMKRAYERR